MRWNDSLQVMIPNALQPAQIEEVFLYPRLGRAIVLVKEDQLSLAIGRRGQNVRLASKLVGWDIEIMTLDELNEGIERAEGWFHADTGRHRRAGRGVHHRGLPVFDDLTFLEPAELAELGGIDEDQAEDIIAYAEEAAERIEEESQARRRRPVRRNRRAARWQPIWRRRREDGDSGRGSRGAADGSGCSRRRWGDCRGGDGDRSAGRDGCRRPQSMRKRRRWSRLRRWHGRKAAGGRTPGVQWLTRKRGRHIGLFKIGDAVKIEEAK